MIVTAPHAAIPPARNPQIAEGFFVVAMAVLVVMGAGRAKDGTWTTVIALVPEDCIDELDMEP